MTIALSPPLTLDLLLLNQAPRAEGVAGTEHRLGVFSVFRMSVCMYVRMSRFWYPLMKRPIMDGFQSLRYLWKHLDKMIQSIMLKFLKTKNLTKKDPLRVL